MTKTPVSAVVSPRDLEMLANGRQFERMDIIKELETIATASLRTNPEHSLHIGFVIQAIKAMPHA